MIEGRVRFRVGRKRVVPEPGAEIVVAPRARHSFKNIGEDEAQIRAVVSPASEIQPFLEDAAALARAGYYTRHGLVTGLKGALEMAAFIERYRDVAVILWPPRPIQGLLVAARRLVSRRDG